DAQEKHWWFVVRRKLLSQILDELNYGPDTPILDIGTGTGNSLRLLKERQYRNVVGVDFYHDPLHFCRMSGFKRLAEADVSHLPFADRSFPLVLATDVVEHIDDDQKALEEIYRVMAPGGSLIIIVPAFQSLWGLQDRVSHHKRRYLLPQI